MEEQGTGKNEWECTYSPTHYSCEQDDKAYQELLDLYNEIEPLTNVGLNDAALQKLNLFLIVIHEKAPSIDSVVAGTLQKLVEVGEIDFQEEPIHVADNLKYTDTQEFTDLGKYLRTLVQGGLDGKERIEEKYKEK